MDAVRFRFVFWGLRGEEMYLFVIGGEGCWVKVGVLSKQKLLLINIDHITTNGP